MKNNNNNLFTLEPYKCINTLILYSSITAAAVSFFILESIGNSTDLVPNLLSAAVVPIRTYSNSDRSKLDIYKENKGKSGIYRWVNKESGKCYVGSSTNLSRRLSSYYSFSWLILQKGSYICRALLKYGYYNFALEILEYCEPSKCISREQYYLDLLKPEYNILKTAGSTLGFKHAEETINKFRARKHSEDTKKRISEAHRDKHTEEAKKRMSEAKKNMTEETKKRMSAAKKGNKARLGLPRSVGAGRPSVQLKVLDLVTGIQTVYSSISDAAIALGTTKGSISKYFSQNTDRPFKGRFYIKK